MSETIAFADSRETGKAPSMGKFERYLTLWVALCICGDGNRPFRISVGRGALNRRRRIGRSAGDALRRPPRPPLARVVRARRPAARAQLAGRSSRKTFCSGIVSNGTEPFQQETFP
jgi:hypothetical protein